MSAPFLGQITMISFTFPPKGWAFCNGQLLPINQNQALFSLLGTTFGGDGRVTFALPDLRGRAPVHARAGNMLLGQSSGAVNHTLGIDELPTHTHAVMASNNQATGNVPVGNVLAVKLRRGRNVYSLPPAPLDLQNLNPGVVSEAPGGSQPHTNTQPLLVINFVIALQGIFPSPN